MKQPAVDHRVKRAVGRLYVQLVERGVPLRCRFDKRSFDSTRFAVSRDQGTRPGEIRTLAEEKHDFLLGAGRKRHGDLECRARIEASAHLPRQPRAQQGVRLVERAVAADELLALARDGLRARRRISERNAARKITCVWVSSEERSGLLVGLGDDERRRLVARDAEDELRIAKDGKAPALARHVADSQPRDLHGISGRHKQCQLGFDTARRHGK